MERPLSANRKSSVEDRDPEEVAIRVRQAIQRENNPVQSAELFSRHTVCLSHTSLLTSVITPHFHLQLYTLHTFDFIQLKFPGFD